MLKKIIPIIILGLLIAIGIWYFSQQETPFGAFYPVAGGRYKLAGSGISSSATTVTLQSFTETISGEELAMADFGEIGYGVVDPGTSKKEIISFTGITQSGTSDKADLTGVVRGLQFTYPFTASTSLQTSHSGGARFIITNVPQFYQKYANIETAVTIDAVWTYNSSSIPRLDAYLAPTLDAEFAAKAYVDSVATSGAANADYTTEGVIELATTTEIAAGTKLGGTGAFLVVPADIFNQTSSATEIVPITNSSGKLDQDFLDLTEAWTLSGVITLSGTTTISGELTLGTVGNTYTFPVSDGDANQVLITDGAGALTWQGGSATITVSTSTNSRNSNTAEKSTSTPTYVKLKETLLNDDLAAARIVMDIRTDQVGLQYRVRIYKNGVAIGNEEVWNSDTNWASTTEDFTGFESGDLIQVYMHGEAGHEGLGYVKNVRFLYDRNITAIANYDLVTELPIEAISVTNQDP